MNKKIGIKDSIKIIKRIWEYGGKLKYVCIIAALISSMSALFYAYINSYLYQLFVYLCTDVKKDKTVHSIIVVLCIVVLVIVVFAACYMIIALTNVKVKGAAKKDVYSHTMNLKESKLNSTNYGDIFARVTKDLDNACEIMGSTFLGYDNPYSILVTAIGTAIIILHRNWILGCISFVLTLSNIFIVNHYIEPLQKKENDVRKASSVAGEVIVNTLSGLMESHIFGFQKHLEQKYTVSADKMYQSSVSIIRKKANIQLVASFQGVVSIVGIMLLGLYLVKKGYLDIGDIVFVTNMQITMSSTVTRFGERIAAVQKNLVSARRFLDYMDWPEESERSDTKYPNIHSDKAIELKNVNFRYDDAEQFVLTNINLQINNGERIAFVGGSGGGKTTLLQLMLQFQTIESGEIIIMGNDIKDYSLKTLRELFSYVPQDCYLFDGTIKENILLGNPDASDNEVLHVLEQVDLKEFITTLDHGYNTEIGEGGARLSGGQKQRIAIARAMLKDAPIILLDEATSSLDSASEKEVKQALMNLMKKKTCITIAHRLSTIKDYDKIVVLEKGQIVECGNHETLLEKNARYTELYQMQFV